jgi:hypothetical protein
MSDDPWPHITMSDEIRRLPPGWDPVKRAAQIAAAQAIRVAPCPTCGAPSGRKCVTASGNAVSKSHVARGEP